MNNILSDAKIEQINNADTRAIKELFDIICNDADYKTRKDQRLGVNNRLLLEPATVKEVYGRDADGVPVYVRPNTKGWSSTTEINQKLHKDYPNIISTTKAGYMSGIEIAGDNEVANQFINDFMKANNFEATHSDMVSKCSAYGVKALRLFSDDMIGLSYGELEPWTYAPFYSKTGRLIAVMQWEETSKSVQDNYSVGSYRVNLLTDKEDMYFWTNKTGDNLQFNSQQYPAIVTTAEEMQDGRRPHSFKGVPVVEFFNNKDGLGDVEKTLDAQDARDELLSKATSTFTAFSDVILVDETEDDKNGQVIGKEEFEIMVKQMRDFGKLDGKWKWLVKNYEGYEALSKHIIQLEQDIYEGSSSYNPNTMGSEGTGATAYQIRQKLKPLIDSSIKTEQQFKKAYMELFRLVLTHGVAKENNNDYLDINIDFQHTIPEDKIATLKMLYDMGVTISRERGYTEAGYKWEEEKLKLEEDKANVMSELDNEADE
jgi:SPP1 family phage portal protein